ncbi:NACHT domain-containing protein [Streptomyces sp. HUAS MG91]|uniref:NACHT domain-containing protein n=1 Tax=Streptomyces tabacisoli TaxID=3156398 RepID=A0AAU8IJZ3_9ACTN
MLELGGRRQRRRWVIIAVLCGTIVAASAAYAVRQIAHGGLEPGDTAGLLSLPLGAAGLVAAVVALRKPVAGNDGEQARGWAITLARQVQDGESRVWRQLLGDDTRRINLRYVLEPDGSRVAEAPVTGQVFAEAQGPTAVPDVLEYYRTTRPKRLAITGEAGAGKTVLALELLLALLEDRKDDDPVPVRVPLTLWDTDRQSLSDLMAQRLVDAYDWPPRMAASLVEHGRVIPVLDGLDEMDPLLPTGAPDPHAPRAGAVLEALNAYQQGRHGGPFILTSRLDHYNALTAGTRLLDAARVTIAPVGITHARTYLADRALDLPRWQPLLDHLATRPTSALTTMLSTPWRLCLVATVYHRAGGPDELLAFTDASALEEHLLARYLPATTAVARGAQRYSPRDVHLWLHHLAVHLSTEGPSGQAGDEATDISLLRLWPFVGRTRVLRAEALLNATITLLPLPLAWTTPRPGLLALIIGIFSLVTSLGTLFTHAQPAAQHLDWHLTVMKLLYITTAPCIGLLVGLLFGGPIALGLGVTFGLFLGVIAAITGEPSRAATPRGVLRGEILYAVAYATVTGVTFGSAIGLAYGTSYGVAIGIWIAFSTFWTNGTPATRRYLVFLLCSFRRLPFRLARFLDWAASAGLLRYSGPAYQYRHRELQRWLAAHSAPPPSVPTHL